MPHLLLVEDSPELAENLADILREAGLTPEVVHSAEQALDQLRARTFDLIISDLRLPARSGVDLLQSLRALGLQTPLILMSAFADSAAQACAQRLGVAAVLAKPFDCEALLSLVFSLTTRPVTSGR
jgi:DNA-binding response OmpR family regulator